MSIRKEMEERGCTEPHQFRQSETTSAVTPALLQALSCFLRCRINSEVF